MRPVPAAAMSPARPGKRRLGRIELGRRVDCIEHVREAHRIARPHDVDLGRHLVAVAARERRERCAVDLEHAVPPPLGARTLDDLADVDGKELERGSLQGRNLEDGLPFT